MSTQEEVYHDKAVRLCELTVNRTLLENITFKNCHILGPAVIARLDDNVFDKTVFEGEPDALLWEVQPNRKKVIGAIGMRNCRLISCRTTNVGFAGPHALIAQFRASVPLGPLGR